MAVVNFVLLFLMIAWTILMLSLTQEAPWEFIYSPNTGTCYEYYEVGGGVLGYGFAMAPVDDSYCNNMTQK